MRILFVCTGNTCRSPLAEAIGRKLAAERGIDDVTVSSAGTGAVPGAPASDGALLIGVEMQMDLTGHRARTLTSEIVRDSDLILTMSGSHLDLVKALGGEGKAFLLDEYASKGESRQAVPDPFGGTVGEYRLAGETLTRLVGAALDRVTSGRTSGG
jgi:protein-tyrosine phosphatase